MNKKERNREREREREQKQKWDSETAVVYVKIEWISGSSAFTSAYDTNFKFRDFSEPLLVPKLPGRTHITQ